jgi:hypothetical protein
MLVGLGRAHPPSPPFQHPHAYPSPPVAAQVTGTGWYRNFNGHSYLMAVVQHPYNDYEDKEAEPSFSGFDGWVGAFTFPAGGKLLAADQNRTHALPSVLAWPLPPHPPSPFRMHPTCSHRWR